MTKPPFTARTAAKFVAQAIVQRKATQITEDVLTDYTRFEEDDLIVDLGGNLVGWYVSDKLRPVTDKIVDRTSDFIANKREARKARKAEKTTTE